MELGTGPPRPLPYIQQAPKLELKQRPSHLRYAYLGESSTLPIIIANSISQEEKDKLLKSASGIQISYWVDYSRYQRY